MATKRRPTLRAVRLGQELRRLREEADFSVRSIGADLGIDPGNVSKMESGKLPATIRDVDNYLRVCNVHDPKRRDDLHKICRDVTQKGWWEGYIEDIAGVLMDRIWLESKTEAIDAFAAILIPGLLQVPGYAEGLMRLDRPEATDDEIQRWIEVRTTRQHILTTHDPVQYSVVIDEAVLKRPAGGVEAMDRQLDYLVQMSERPNIEIRILPFSVGMHASLTGGFEILRLEDPYPEACLLTVPGGDVCVEGDMVDTLAQTYDRVLKASLGPEASRELIIAERNSL
ncbi:helix-turn-helix domain-containing protein [Phytomonospora endophytica]|uniref:Transcriptional regulator with XRE-family HTH domain n=1 Tax=Phytomonospora endophytica TaxID=714109 RepID=A0A841FVQ2_9ACTN|nr:helix-turn-helix transcriptional regulator [Phytomonospora endophytica]MBB6039864.1 transcriptional regulator with XRE-family HTH domain [Phytomonospora endophytica]